MREPAVICSDLVRGPLLICVPSPLQISFHPAAPEECVLQPGSVHAGGRRRLLRPRRHTPHSGKRAAVRGTPTCSVSSSGSRSNLTGPGCWFLLRLYRNVHVCAPQGGLLSALGSLAMMVWLSMTPHSPETEQKRLAILAGFAFLTGWWS